MKKITFLLVLIFSLTSYASIKILSGYSIILPKNKEENLDKLDKLIEFFSCKIWHYKQKRKNRVYTYPSKIYLAEVA